MISKYEVHKSADGGCFVCSKNDRELFLARQATTGLMTAICACCLLHGMDEFLIDNTRAWPIMNKEG